MEEDGQCYQEMKLNEPPKCCGQDMDFVDGCYICDICGFSEEDI